MWPVRLAVRIRGSQPWDQGFESPTGYHLYTQTSFLRRFSILKRRHIFNLPFTRLYVYPMTLVLIAIRHIVLYKLF